MTTETLTKTSEDTAKLIELLQTEPESRDILYKTLVFCESQRTATEIEHQINIWTENRTILHKPQALLSILIAIGGLQQSKGADGQVYISTTTAGKQAISASCPSVRLGHLFSTEPEFIDTYIEILELCKDPKSLSELEDIIPQPDIIDDKAILVSYFVGQLEESGGLEWNIKWHTTEDGLNVLKNLCS